MKRALKSITAMVLTVFMLLNVAVFANEEKEISVFVNGTKIEFDVPPMTENDRTLVPMRFIFEALGAEVEWNNDTNTATASKGDITISITVDNNVMIKNGTEITLDVPARLINDRTLVPVRAVSEGMDAKVDWNEELQQVIIETVNTGDDSSETIVGIVSTNQGYTPIEDVNTGDDSSGTIVGIVSTNQGYTPIEDVMNYNELSDEDMQLLKDSYNNIIRYNFEQYLLPAAFIGSDETTTEFIKNKDQKAIDLVNEVWNEVVVGKIIDIQLNSETTYRLEANDIAGDIEKFVAAYMPIIQKAGLEASKYFKSSFVDLKDGSTMLLVNFNETDTLLACKYIGIVLTSDNNIRYFTAETDILEEKSLFICEIDDLEEARGKTHVLIEKLDDEKLFIGAIEGILKNSDK